MAMVHNNKFIDNVCVKTLLFLLISFMVSVLLGCEISEDNLKTQDEFTIRVFDSGSNEEKKSYERYYYDYTSSTISFVIKVYRNGEEIYETNLQYLLENQGVGSLIRVRTTYSEFFADNAKTGRKLPIDKGWYIYEIEFNRMHRWDGEIIQKQNLNDFYLTFYIDYDYYMSVKEK